MTRATLIPPPPGSRRGAAQRNLLNGAIWPTDVETSMAGLGVMVMICVNSASSSATMLAGLADWDLPDERQ
jgi:hypothetical protein